MITEALLDELASVAEAEGVMRLSAVRLDHPGFAPARAYLDRFLDEGRAGEMAFLERSRDARKDPATMLPDARTLLVGVVPYGGEPGPIARYARTADYHTRRARETFARRVASRGPSRSRRAMTRLSTMSALRRGPAACPVAW